MLCNATDGCSIGTYYEVSGVEQDIVLKVFTKEDIFGGHKETVRKIVQMIGNKKSLYRRDYLRNGLYEELALCFALKNCVMRGGVWLSVANEQQ
jgi:hypothetical protein